MEQFKFYFWLFSEELWNKKWFFLLLIWVLSAVAILVVFLIPDQYRTRASISIDTDQLLAQVIKDTGGVIGKSAEVQALRVSQMIYSTDILRSVLRDVSPENYDISPAEEARKLELMRTDLKFTNKSPISEQKDFYEISYVHKDPVIAFNTLKKILELFIETNIKKTSSQNSIALSVAEDNLSVKQKELSIVQTELAEFKQKNIGLSEGSNVFFGELQRINETIKNYPSEKGLLQSKLTSLTSLLSQTPRYLSSGQQGGNPMCDFSDIQKELANLSARGLTNIHPDVIHNMNLLERKKEACANSGGNDSGASSAPNPAYLQLSEQVANLKSEINILDLNYKAAKERDVELNDLLKRLPLIQEKLRNFEEKVRKSSEALKEATSNYDVIQNTISLNNKSGIISYEIVENVQMPIIPEKPNRLLLFIGAFLSSLIGAASYILVKFKLEQTMPTINHLRDAFDLPVLGSITTIEKPDEGSAFFDVMIWCIGFVLLLAVYGTLIKIVIFSPIKFDYSFINNFINKSLSFFV